MKNITVGQTIEIFANIGVIGGLILLAFELHQNNELLEAEANLVLSQNRISANELLATDDGLSQAFIDGLNGEQLSQLQTLKLERFYVAVFTRWEWEHEQFRRGLIDGQNLPVSDWRAIVRAWPNMAKFWEIEQHNGRSADFVQFMAENVLSD